MTPNDSIFPFVVIVDNWDDPKENNIILLLIPRVCNYIMQNSRRRIVKSREIRRENRVLETEIR